MRISNTEIAEILGVKANNLKQIKKNGQLEQRLKDKGYTIIGQEKEGRQLYYILEQENNDKEIINNIIFYMFNTREYNKFAKYYLYRLQNLDRPLSSELLSKLVGVNSRTIKRWDKLMLDNNILVKDGKWYIAIDYVTDTKKIHRSTDIWEYNSYVKNLNMVNYKSLEKYKKDDITRQELRMLQDSSEVREEIIKDKFVYYVRKYDLKKGYRLSIDIAKLIQDVYKLKMCKHTVNLY